jgi:hypothetical protein
VVRSWQTAPDGPQENLKVDPINLIEHACKMIGTFFDQGPFLDKKELVTIRTIA